MQNSLNVLANAFRDQYHVSFCLLNQDAEHSDLILSLRDTSGLVARRQISAAQRACPHRLNNLIQSIHLGIAIDTKQSPMQTLSDIHLDRI